MTDRIDDSERKSWYGAGRQPFDVIVEDTPWAVGFCTGNILKYLRRHGKQPLNDQWFDVWVPKYRQEQAKAAAITYSYAHSLESARWYYRHLRKWAADNDHAHNVMARLSLELLFDRLLTDAEKKMLMLE
jgi:hypothetical protein